MSEKNISETPIVGMSENRPPGVIDHSVLFAEKKWIVCYELQKTKTIQKKKRLSSADPCEIARNSVLQSSFPVERQMDWLGVDKPEELYLHFFFEPRLSCNSL